MDIEIVTYWNVETLYYVFQAVASLMAGAGFAGIMKMIFIFAIAIGIFSYGAGKQLEMATWFFQALFFVTLLNMPIARVTLTDRANQEPPRTVSNVPFALAAMGQMSNSVFGFLTRQYETTFGVPDDLGLAQGDVGFGHRILKQVNRATIRDAGLNADLMQYFKECTIYDVKDGVIGYNDLQSTDSAWSLVFGDTNPARYVTYDSLTANPQTVPCTEAAIVLQGRVNDATTAAQNFYGKQTFPRAQSDALATQYFVGSIGTSYDWILKNSANSSNALKQGMFNTIWKDAGTQLPSLLNDPTRVAEMNALAGASVAARQADGSNGAMALLAQETLPHMRNWIEAIIYALFPVIVVLMVVMSLEGAKKLLGGYMMAMAWIGLWPLLFAVINHLSLMHLQKKMAALSTAANGVPFQMSNVFDATLSDEQTMIGYMVVLVPFIAASIIKMGQGGFMSLSDKMMTGFASAGSSAGASMAMGNMSAGQVGLDTVSANTTSMHKYDTDMSMKGGGSSMSLADGGMLRRAMNGDMARDDFQSNMGFGNNLNAGSSASAEQSRASNLTSTEGQQTSLGDASTATLNRTQGHDNSKTATQGVGSSSSIQTVGATTNSTGTGTQLNRQNSENGSTVVGNSSSEGASLGVTGGGGGDGGAGGGVGGRGGAGVSGGPSKGATWTAGNTRVNASGTSTNESENNASGASVTQQGTIGSQSSNGVQTNQTDKNGADAILGRTASLTDTKDVGLRSDNSAGSRVAASKSTTYTEGQDLAKQPAFWRELADRKGMSYGTLMASSQGTRQRLASEYIGEMQAIKSSTALPKTDMSGNTMQSATELRGDHQAGASGLAGQANIAGKHQANVRASGAGSTRPIAGGNGAATATIAGAQGRVDANTSASSPTSLPNRTAEFNDRAGQRSGMRDKDGKAVEHGYDNISNTTLIADMQANEAKAGVVRAKNAALGTVSNLANGELKSGNATLDGKELPSHVTQDAPVVPPKSK